MPQFKFFNNCVNWDLRDVHRSGGLCDMIDAATVISRKTFLKHVDRESIQEIEKSLGYTLNARQGLTMAGDYHVSFHRSKLHGRRVYYFRHSAIEYVFTN